MLFDVIVTVEAAIDDSSVVATIDKIRYLYGGGVRAKEYNTSKGRGGKIWFERVVLEQATEVLKQFGRLPFYKTTTINEVRSHAIQG